MKIASTKSYVLVLFSKWPDNNACHITVFTLCLVQPGVNRKQRLGCLLMRTRDWSMRNQGLVGTGRKIHSSCKLGHLCQIFHRLLVLQVSTYAVLYIDKRIWPQLRIQFNLLLLVCGVLGSVTGFVKRHPCWTSQRKWKLLGRTAVHQWSRRPRKITARGKWLLSLLEHKSPQCAADSVTKNIIYVSLIVIHGLGFHDRAVVCSPFNAKSTAEYQMEQCKAPQDRTLDKWITLFCLAVRWAAVRLVDAGRMLPVWLQCVKREAWWRFYSIFGDCTSVQKQQLWRFGLMSSVDELVWPTQKMIRCPLPSLEDSTGQRQFPVIHLTPTTL